MTPGKRNNIILYHNYTMSYLYHLSSQKNERKEKVTLMKVHADGKQPPGVYLS